MSSISLAHYLQQREQHIPTALANVLQCIAQTCQQIDIILQKGALAGVLGNVGVENVQGETQKKLDVISNDLLIDNLQKHANVAGLASEELDDFTPAQDNGEYLVLFDPLDGSSNLDINMAVGTIFSILPAINHPAQAQDFLQMGTQQVASGYVLYGPSTMLALTTGQGVDIFTLDIEKQEFILTAEQVKIDADTQEFAINSSNQRHWEAPVQRYVEELLAGKTSVRGKDFNMRWVGCMVGDVHRILCRGGIFMYPYDTKSANRKGRLRLLYEANPMSFLIEQAGGESSTARLRIMTIQPTEIHERVPVVLGAKNEVDLVVSYHTQA